MKVLGPDSKYMMQWGGEWRAVVNMFDGGKAETTNPTRATTAVLYVSDEYWVACVISPGDVLERLDRDQNARTWDYLT